MKHLVTQIKKHAKHVTKHLHKHKHHYALASFGSFAVIKMIALFAGFFGIAQFGGTFAQEPVTLPIFT